MLSAARVRALRDHLDALLDQHDLAAALDRDPLAFPRRYDDPRDQEIAAFYAGFLAFGRVDLFRPVLAAWFDWLDLGGGPYARTRSFTIDQAEPLLPLYYRWVRGPHLVHLMLAFQALLRDHDSLEPLFTGHRDPRVRLTRGVDAVRDALVATSGLIGPPVDDPDALPRALRYVVATPRSGSACKRWHMILRWLVRPDDGVDLGLWTSLTPADLLMPVDVHVLRMSRFLGLTRRPDASWRTATEITRNLRRLDPSDPVRYDFALAHLGISGDCLGHRDPEVCPGCPLNGLCRAPPAALPPRDTARSGRIRIRQK